MKRETTIFEQLIKPLDRNLFEELAQKYKADRYVKEYRTWDHFLTLLYAQVTHQESLRALTMNFNQFIVEKGLEHLKPVSRSTLSDANMKRPEGLYRELFYRLVSLLNRSNKNTFTEAIRIIDSTPIVLSGRGMDWADSNARTVGLKMHVIYDPELGCPLHFSFSSPRVNDIQEGKKIRIQRNAIYLFDRAYYDFGWWSQFTKAHCTFVTRPKTTLKYKIVERAAVLEAGILYDHRIQLTSKKGKKHEKMLRIIKISGEINGRRKIITVITNNQALPASKIAALYKTRWQIELFFKWIKQNLKIKKFLSENENAIKIQIIVGLIACILIKLLQIQLKSPLSMRNIIAFLRCNIGTAVWAWVILRPPQSVLPCGGAGRRITL
jgi:hypothetical protein